MFQPGPKTAFEGCRVKLRPARRVLTLRGRRCQPQQVERASGGRGGAERCPHPVHPDFTLAGWPDVHLPGGGDKYSNQGAYALARVAVPGSACDALTVANANSLTGNSEVTLFKYLNGLVVAGVGFEPTTFRL